MPRRPVRTSANACRAAITRWNHTAEATSGGLSLRLAQPSRGNLQNTEPEHRHHEVLWAVVSFMQSRDASQYFRGSAADLGLRLVGSVLVPGLHSRGPDIGAECSVGMRE